MQSIELAIEEMRYARNELGMRSGFLRPNPYNDRMLGHRDYDVFWAEAQDLDFAIGVHEGTGGMPAAGADRFEELAPRHIVSHTVEMMLASLSIIWDGVCERFPEVAHCVFGVGRRLDCALAGSHGPPLRRPWGVYGLTSHAAPERVFQAPVLDFVRTG